MNLRRATIGIGVTLAGFVASLFFVLPAAAATCAYNTTQATCACTVTGPGVTCYNGELFRSSDTSCATDPRLVPVGSRGLYGGDDRWQLSCPSDVNWVCNRSLYPCGTCDPATSSSGASCSGNGSCPNPGAAPSPPPTAVGGIYTNVCSSIGCPGGTTLCGSPSPGYCVPNRVCPAGTTWNVCSDKCTTPYVLLNPPATVDQVGDVRLDDTNIYLNGPTAGKGNLIMNDGKAIRVDKNGTSSLYLGNWGGPAGLAMPFDVNLVSRNTGGQTTMTFGDAGCSTSLIGLGIGSMTACNNYTVLGGDGNTYINRDNNKSLLFQMAGTGGTPTPSTQMVLSSGGSLGVGIGSTAPASVLQIKGTQTWGTDFSLDATQNSGHRWVLVSTAAAASEGNGLLLIKDQNGNGGAGLVGMSIDPSGNVTTAGTLTAGSPSGPSVKAAANQNLIYANMDATSDGNLLLLQRGLVDKFKVDKDGLLLAGVIPWARITNYAKCTAPDEYVDGWNADGTPICRKIPPVAANRAFTNLCAGTPSDLTDPLCSITGGYTGISTTLFPASPLTPDFGSVAKPFGSMYLDNTLNARYGNFTDLLTAQNGVLVSKPTGLQAIRVLPGAGVEGVRIVANGAPALAVRDAGDTKTVMAVTQSGAVGVGTATPAEAIEVRDDSAGTARARVTDTAQNPELQLQYGAGADNHWSFYVNNAATKDLRVWGPSGGSDRMTITQGGLVGVGTTNPSSLLSVGATSQFQVNASGAVVSGTWNGTTVAPGYGGTGLSSYASGDTLYASAPATLARLPIGAQGFVMTVQGGTPTWSDPAGYGALLDLSNLIPTRVNQSLVPMFDASIDIGSVAKRWRDGYFSGQLNVGPSGAPIPLALNASIAPSGVGGDQAAIMGRINSNRAFGNSYGMELISTEMNATNNSTVFGLYASAATAGTAASGVYGGDFSAVATGAANTVPVTAIRAKDAGSAANSAGDHYGLYADISTGSGGTHYGVYSTVAGGTARYPGVFLGGGVGIGTAAPGYRLDVRDDSGPGGTAIIRLNQDNATKLWTGLRLDRQTSEKWFVGMDDTTNDFIVRRAGSSNDLRVSASTGRVLLNTLQVATGAQPGYVLVSTNASGDAAWQSMSSVSCGNEVFAGLTPATYSGNVGSGTCGGSPCSGYLFADERCNATYPGAHVCSVEEVLRSERCANGNLVALGNGINFWLNGGPPGYTALANDCQGWTDASGSTLGRKWKSGVSSGGSGLLTVCSQSLQYGCCR